MQFSLGMQLKALITTLLLGSSSVALADTQIRDHRTHTATATVVAPAPVVTKPNIVVTNRLDGRVDGRWNIVRRQPLTYVTLANNLALDGRALIRLQPMKRQFSKLELRAEGNGRTVVDKVIVHFANGRSQTIDLDAKLNGKKQRAISIDLKGDSRNIERVIVVGKSNGRNASLDVLAI